MKRNAGATAALIGAAFFLISWFFWTDGRHFIDGGDVFFPIDQVLVFSKLAHIWWPDQLGSITYNVSVLPLRSIFALLQLAGLSSVNVQRLFLAAGYAAAAGGMYLCAREFWRGRAAPAIAAIWYPCSITYCLAVPNENNVVALAILPALVFLALRALDDLVYVIPFAVITILFGFVAANPPTLVLLAAMIAAFWLMGAYDRKPPKRVASTGLWLLAAAIAANFWWVPATKIALAANAMAAQGVADWSWALQRTNLVSVIEQTSFWGFGFGSDPWLTLGQWYLNHPLPHTAIVLTPILAFSVLYFPASSREQRLRLAALTIVCVAAILLAKGEGAPFSSIGAWLYANVPGMFLYREPVKFLFVLAFALPLLAAAAYYEIETRISRPASYVLGALFVGVPVVTGWVLLSGWAFSMQQSQARIQIPEYWRSAMNFVNQRNTAADAVLLLPEDGFYQAHYTWGLDGVDRIAETTLHAPVVRLIADQNAYLQNAFAGKALRAFDDALRSQRADWIRNELGRFSIGYIVVRGDLMPDGRTMSLPEIRLVLRLIGARRIAQYGPLSIYEVQASPRVTSAMQILRSCASPSAELQLGMQLPPNVTIIRSFTRECRRNPQFLQGVPSSGGVLARAGSIVVTERNSGESTLPLRRQIAIVPDHLRLAPYASLAAKPGRVPARFCGPWVFQQTNAGWTAHRCVALNDAAYIVFTAPPYTSKHYPALLKFHWLPGVDDVSVPLEAELNVPANVHFAQVSVVSGPMTPDRSAVRAAANAMRIETVYAMEPVGRHTAEYYRVDRPLVDGMAINALDMPAEFIFRLPSGQRISAFVGARSVPTRFEAVRVFERAYQFSPLSSQGELRRSDVLFEGVSLPFVQRTSAMPDLTLALPANRWSIKRLQHDARIASTPGVQMYAGHPLAAAPANVTFTGTQWWNRMQLQTSGAGWIAVRQAYSDQWAMPGSTTHAVLDGYGDAWYVPRAGSYTAFVPLEDTQRLLYAAAVICVLALSGAVVYWRRRREAA